MTILMYVGLGVLLAAVILYKYTLRLFFGMVIIPEDKIGLITKKFVLFGSNRSMPDGQLIALNGEPGFQADTLAPGLYWGFWPWQYEINKEPFVKIEKGKIGLIVANDGKAIPTGNILARGVESNSFQDARAFLKNGGCRGKQVNYLNNGIYRINTMLFNVVIADVTTIPENQIGVITALEGIPLEPGSIAGDNIEGHNNFQDFDVFLKNGGNKGVQTQVIQSGSYTLNPWAIKIEFKPMTVIPTANVGVVISYVGTDSEDISGSEFRQGSIVENGHKGVWSNPLPPGKYAINPYIQQIEIVPTANLVLNWANARTESHDLDKNLSTITVRSKDGFSFNLDVSQVIHIAPNDAPKVIVRFGTMRNLVSQVLEPTIGNYFRNSAQSSDAIDFLKTREERQVKAKEMIGSVLRKYNVNAEDTLIGDIVLPPQLLETLTQRKIAQEQEVTFENQTKAQDQRKKLESAKALADMQGEMVAAQQSVEIAQRKAEAEVKRTEGETKTITLKAAANSDAVKITAEAKAKEIELIGIAEASKIQAIGEATAEAYKQQVEAMGEENFAKFKITEEIGKNGIKIIPEILIQGNGDSTNGSMSGLMAVELLDYIKKNNKTTEK